MNCFWVGILWFWRFFSFKIQELIFRGAQLQNFSLTVQNMGIYLICNNSVLLEF